MILLTGCMLVCLNVVSGFFLNNDPCDLWPLYSGGIPESPDFTTSVYVPSQCRNGTFRWDYPKGHVMVHFPNTNRIERKICFGDRLAGDVFTVVDLTNGANYTLQHFERDSQKLVCSKLTAEKETLLRIDAPSTMYYMGEMMFEIES